MKLMINQHCARVEHDGKEYERITTKVFSPRSDKELDRGSNWYQKDMLGDTVNWVIPYTITSEELEELYKQLPPV